MLLQVASPESSYEDDGEAEKAKGEDLLKHLGGEHLHPIQSAWSLMPMESAIVRLCL